LDNSAVTNVVTSLVTNGVAAGNGLYSSANSYGFLNGPGYLQVLSGPNGPGIITNSLSGNALTLTWPAGQGWRLLIQTNPPNTGLGTNWVAVPNSNSTNSMLLNVDGTTGSVFFRLIWP
jgi:hypothetical protein